MKRRLILYVEKTPARRFGGAIFIFLLIEGLFSFCFKTCPAFSDAAFDAWFSKGSGVVGFETYPALERWAED